MEHTVWLDNGKLASNPMLEALKIKFLFKFDISCCRAGLTQQVKLFDDHVDLNIVTVRPSKEKMKKHQGNPAANITIST